MERGKLPAAQELRRARRFFLGTPPSRRHQRASLAPEPAGRRRAQELAAPRAAAGRESGRNRGTDTQTSAERSSA